VLKESEWMEVFTEMKIKIAVFWVLTPRSDEVGYLKLEAVKFSETLVSYRITT
jgi:hypothetical protein